MVVLGVFVALASACNAASPSIEEFTAMADAVCADYTTKIAAAEAAGEDLLPLQVAMLQGVVELPRPTEQPPALKRVLAALDISAERAAARPDRGFRGEPVTIEDIDAAGFKICGARDN